MSQGPRTLAELFLDAVERYGGRPAAMRVKRGGRWVEIGHRELGERVAELSLGLRALGVAPGDRVALLSENRPEWAIADYACLTARLVDVPVYPTLPQRQVEHVLRDSGARVALVSNRAQRDKVLAARPHLPALRELVAFDADAAGDGIRPLEEVLALGRAVPDRAAWRAEALAARPDDLVTLIYTSGTTGDPKGVMLTHGNITSNINCAVPLFPFEPADEILSFLPLSHIFERMIGHYAMLHLGVVINYAESVETVAADMLERRPTVMAAVPRLYEKVYGRVLDAARASPAPRRALFSWAKRVSERRAELSLAGRPIPRGLAVRHAVADRLVFAKVRARVGGRVRFFISGGAPLPPEVGLFFHAAGLPIYEGYGLTETSPVISANTPGRVRLGTVGCPVPGVEVRIAEDGEIVVRGPNVMRGYWNRPDATAEAIDADGWFHTGDIGALDPDGHLRITDRKKDLIITAQGKNIAPQPIEALAKGCRHVANAVMLGDGRRFPIMLVVPNPERLRQWAERRRIAEPDMAALLARPEVRAMLEAELRAAFSDLAPFETPKRLLFLAEDFSLERGELTPTLKVRRRAVEQHYRAAIDALYAEAAAPEGAFSARVAPGGPAPGGPARGGVAPS